MSTCFHEGFPLRFHLTKEYIVWEVSQWRIICVFLDYEK